MWRNLKLLPIDDSIFNHVNTFRIFIGSEAIIENVIPQFLIYQQKAFYKTDTIYDNKK